MRLCLKKQISQRNQPNSFSLLHSSHVIGNELRELMLFLLATQLSESYCVSSFCLQTHFQKFLYLSYSLNHAPSFLLYQSLSFTKNCSVYQPVSKVFKCTPPYIHEMVTGAESRLQRDFRKVFNTFHGKTGNSQQINLCSKNQKHFHN